MLIARNICKMKIIVGGKDIFPGKIVKVESLDCIESKVLNGFLEIIEEKEAPIKKKVVKEQPIPEAEVMETKKEIKEEE